MLKQWIATSIKQLSKRYKNQQREALSRHEDSLHAQIRPSHHDYAGTRGQCFELAGERMRRLNPQLFSQPSTQSNYVLGWGSTIYSIHTIYITILVGHRQSKNLIHPANFSRMFKQKRGYKVSQKLKPFCRLIRKFW